MDLRIAPRVVLVAFTVAFAALTSTAAAATGEGPDFAPSVHLAELHLYRTQADNRFVVHWRGHDRVRGLQWFDGDVIADRSIYDTNRSVFHFGLGIPSAVNGAMRFTNAPLVTPDGFPVLELEVMGYAWPLVARVRSGGTLLVATLDGRRVLRGFTRLAANACAGLRAGTRITDLEPATLVPRRVVERRTGSTSRTWRFMPRAARANDFAPLRFLEAPSTRDDGFVRRTSARAVAALVSFPISMPTSLPTGFRFGHLGSAPRGAALGPEASFPRSRGVFFARWSRGLETLDFTIRPAHGTLTRDWDESDPFRGECSSAVTTDVMIGSNTAKYAQGETGSPHMWWRDGTTLYTLTGPFSVEQLATVARSLTPVPG